MISNCNESFNYLPLLFSIYIHTRQSKVSPILIHSYIFMSIGLKYLGYYLEYISICLDAYYLSIKITFRNYKYNYKLSLNFLDCSSISCCGFLAVFLYSSLCSLLSNSCSCSSLTWCNLSFS